MARRKTLPESVRAKYALAERLGALRAEIYGDRGGPELARRLGLPIRTWYNYEAGVTVPAEVVLKIIELTAAEPMWLLHGKGPKFRQASAERNEGVIGPVRSVGALLRTALEMLEQQAESPREVEQAPPAERPACAAEVVLLSVENTPDEPLSDGSGPRYLAARNDWLDAERDCRCIRVTGDAMSPIVCDGAYVAFSEADDELSDFDGKLVVAWTSDQAIVRWFQLHGRFALLRAENPAADPPQILIDLEEAPRDSRFRRVLWINTPH